jgi:hypothetical protein
MNMLYISRYFIFLVMHFLAESMCLRSIWRVD